MAKKKCMTKDNYIKAEIKRLNKIFANFGPQTMDAAQELIQNATFMSVSLRELQDIINAAGYTEEYKNGENQYGIKKKSEVEIYNTMIKNFNTTMKQLFDMFNGVSSGGEGDPLLNYIGGGKN